MAKGGEMRLLMFNTVKSGYNGQMMFILKYLHAMDRSGMRIGYASKSEPLPEIRAQLDELGVQVHTLPSRNRRPIAYLLALARLVRREHYDIVHVHGNSASLALELVAAHLGGARVRIAHSHNTATKHPLLHRLLKPVMLRHATARMACGADAGRWLFGDRPFEIVPIASDPAAFAFNSDTRSRLRSEMGLGEGDILAGMVGQLIPVKNPAFMLDALAEAHKHRPELRLALIGYGPQREMLEARAAALGLSGAVVFTGPVSDVQDRMQAMDLLAMPSLYEGFPNVLVEAQLAGLPALVSENVTRDCDMTGLLTYLPLDRDAWTRALEDFRPADRTAASADARAKIAQRGYDLNAAAAALKRRYRELLDASPSDGKTLR